MMSFKALSAFVRFSAGTRRHLPTRVGELVGEQLDIRAAWLFEEELSVDSAGGSKLLGGVQAVLLVNHGNSMN